MERNNQRNNNSNYRQNNNQNNYNNSNSQRNNNQSNNGRNTNGDNNNGNYRNQNNNNRNYDNQNSNGYRKQNNNNYNNDNRNNNNNNQNDNRNPNNKNYNERNYNNNNQSNRYYDNNQNNGRNNNNNNKSYNNNNNNYSNNQKNSQSSQNQYQYVQKQDNNNYTSQRKNSQLINYQKQFEKNIENQCFILGGQLVIKDKDMFEQIVSAGENNIDYKFIIENMNQLFQFEANDIDYNTKKITFRFMQVIETNEDEQFLKKVIKQFIMPKEKQDNKNEEKQQIEEEKNNEKINIDFDKKVQCQFTYSSWDKQYQLPQLKLESVNKKYQEDLKFMENVVLQTQNNKYQHDVYQSQEEIEQGLKDQDLHSGIFHVIDGNKFYIKTESGKVFFNNTNNFKDTNRALHNNQVYYNLLDTKGRPKADYIWGLKRNKDQYSKPLYGIIFKCEEQIENKYWSDIDESFFQNDNKFEEIAEQEETKNDNQVQIDPKYQSENLIIKRNALYFRPINVQLPPMRVVNINQEVLEHPCFNPFELIFEAKYIDWMPQSYSPYVSIVSIEGSVANDQTFGRVYLKECNVKTDKFDRKIIKTIKDTFCQDADKDQKVLNVTKQSLKFRQDLSQLPTFCIDTQQTRQFDDAFSFVKKQNTLNENEKVFKGYIHIADVSYFLNEKSLRRLDQDAKERKEASYVKSFQRPMIPQILGQNLASLVPNQERYAMTIYFEINQDGLVDFDKLEIIESLIKNDAKFTYQQIENYFKDGKKEDLLNILNNSDKQIDENEFLENLKDMYEICKKRQEMHNKSGYNIAGQEDEDGLSVGTKQNNYNDVIVKEMMILANECIFNFCGNLDKQVDSYQKLVKEKNKKQQEIEKQKRLEKIKKKEELKKKREQQKKIREENKKKRKEKQQQLQEQRKKLKENKENSEEDQIQIEEIEKQQKQIEEESLIDEQEEKDEKLDDSISIAPTELETQLSDISDVDSQKNYSDKSDDDDDDLDFGDVNLQKIELDDARRQKIYLEDIFKKLGVDNLSFESDKEFKNSVDQAKEINKDYPIIIDYINYKCKLASRKIKMLIRENTMKKKKDQKQEKKPRKQSENKSNKNGGGNKYKVKEKSEILSDNEENQEQQQQQQQQKQENDSEEKKENQKQEKQEKKKLSVEEEIKKQIEFYFGDKNLEKDKFLNKKLSTGEDGYIQLSIIESFQKMKSFKKKTEEIIEIIKESQMIELKCQDNVWFIRKLGNKIPKLKQSNQKKNSNKRQDRNEKKQQNQQEIKEEKEDTLQQQQQQQQNSDQKQKQEIQEEKEIQKQQESKVDNTSKENKTEEQQKQEENKETKEEDKQISQEKQEENQIQEEKSVVNEIKEEENQDTKEEVKEKPIEEDKQQQKEEEEQQELEKQKEKERKEVQKQIKGILVDLTESVIEKCNNFDQQLNEKVIQKYIQKKSEDRLPFTNPIRKYCDVMTHNLVKDYLDFYEDLEDFSKEKNIKKNNLQELKDKRDDINDYKKDIKKYQLEAGLIGDKGLDKAERQIQKRDTMKKLMLEDSVICEGLVTYKKTDSRFDRYSRQNEEKHTINVWTKLTEEEEILEIDNNNQGNQIKLYDTVQVQITAKKIFPFTYQLNFVDILKPYQQ